MASSIFHPRGHLAYSFTDMGTSRTIDLIPYGDQVSVTKQNRLQYIYLVSHYRLSKQIKRQSDACAFWVHTTRKLMFLCLRSVFEGLSDIIDPRWLRFVVLVFEISLS